MKILTLEIRIRLSEENQDEARAILEAKYKVMNLSGILSVVQVGDVDDGKHWEGIARD